MAICRAQVILKTVDAVPENYITNTFAFQTLSNATAPTLITPFLKIFYDTLRPYLSPVIQQNNHEIKWTDLPGTPPNYPFGLTTFNFTTPPGGTAIPDEVALCASFEGVRVAGQPQARRRGRVYVGPLNTTALNANRPATLFLTAAGTASKALCDAVEGLGASHYWGVWSQANGAFTPVNNGWSDNAFDTQRRRGVLATTRAVWTT